MTDLSLNIAPVLSTPDFVVRPLVPVTLALPSIEGQIPEFQKIVLCLVILPNKILVCPRKGFKVLNVNHLK